MIWKEKKLSSQIQGRVSISHVTEVGVASMDTFYFVSHTNNIKVFKKAMFLFRCKEMETVKTWVRVLLFLKDEAIRKNAPIEFEE